MLLSLELAWRETEGNDTAAGATSENISHSLIRD